MASGAGKLALAAGTALVMASGVHTHGGLAHLLSISASPVADRHAARKAIRFARHQIGQPYLWGGTGPGGFDCSGLVYEAYRQNIPRTSQAQWASLPHVGSPHPGDLVFFAGADGTARAPGHVGLVTGAHTMIEAYAPGFPVRLTQFGTPGSPQGDQNPVGYADPTAR